MGQKNNRETQKLQSFFFVLFAIIFQMLMFYKRVRHISTTTTVWFPYFLLIFNSPYYFVNQSMHAYSEPSCRCGRQMWLDQVNMRGRTEEGQRNESFTGRLPLLKSPLRPICMERISTSTGAYRETWKRGGRDWGRGEYLEKCSLFVQSFKQNVPKGGGEVPSPHPLSVRLWKSTYIYFPCFTWIKYTRWSRIVAW